jgi:hypothetical protein
MMLAPALRRIGIRPVAGKYALLAFTAICGALALATLFLQLNPERKAFHLDPALISTWSGHAFAYTIPPTEGLFPFLQLRGDRLDDPAASSLVITEDGRALGPPHSEHTDIAISGLGRYSHWGKQLLVFSSSDNSDPRKNGRFYAIQLQLEPPRTLVLAAFAGFVLALCVTIGFMERLSPPQPAAQPAWRVRAFRDTGPVLVFLGIASFCQISLLGHNHPFILTHGDAGNVASFVAGWLHPDRFVNDLVLSDPHAFRFYVTALIPAVMFLNTFVPDLGTAYALLYMPLIFFQLVGFYALGKQLFSSRVWAFLLALFTLPPVDVFSGEFWGVWYEPLTRMTYGAFLPFLLLAFLRYGRSRRWLPWLFVLCGLGVYVYPVAAPTVAFACWTGALTLKPPGERPARHAVRLILGGIVFLTAAVPFAWVFFKGFPSFEASPSPTRGSGGALLATYDAMIGPVYTDALVALKSLLTGTGVTYAYYWIPGLLAFFAVPRLNPRCSDTGRFFRMVILGIFLGSFGIAWLDQRISAMLGRTPIEIDLIRNIRFELPLLCCGFVWAASQVYALLMQARLRVSRIGARMVFGVTLLSVLASWAMWPTYLSYAMHLTGSPLGTTSREDVDGSAIVSYLRGLQPGSSVLPIGVLSVGAEQMGLAIRYGALQPVVYLKKDANALIYSGVPKRAQWEQAHDAMVALVNTTDEAGARIQLRHVLDLLRPKYILFDTRQLPPTIIEAGIGIGAIAMQAGPWMLIQVTENAA